MTKAPILLRVGAFFVHSIKPELNTLANMVSNTMKHFKIIKFVRFFVFSLFLLLIANTVCHATESATQCKFFYDEALYKEAVEPCTIAANNNNLQAQTILGELLDDGSAGNIDRQQAKDWWSKAAANHYLQAENLLALKYYYGGTILEKQKFWQQDYKKAMQIWKKSAERGTPSSQFMVAEMHRLGQGTSINLIEALAWYKLASSGKYKLADESIYAISKIMTQKDKEAAKQKYNEYRHKYK